MQHTACHVWNTNVETIYLYHWILASCIHLRIKIDNWTKMQYISRGSSAVNSWRAQTHPLPGCAGRIGKDPAPKTHDLSNNAPQRTVLVEERRLTMQPFVILYASRSVKPINTSEGTAAVLGRSPVCLKQIS